MAEKSRVRTTKKQLEALITFIEGNPELAENNKLGQNEMEKWEELKNHLNLLDGLSRSIKEWKQVFGDLKTNARRRARQKKYDLNKTGGGPSEEKGLTPLDQRILQLINPITIDGVPFLPEAGVSTIVEMNVVENTQVTLENLVDNDDTEFIVNAEDGTINIDNDRSTSSRKTNYKSRIRRKTKKRPLFSEVGLKHLIESQVRLANSINNLASSIKYMAKNRK